jgi:hypothetical protein
LRSVADGGNTILNSSSGLQEIQPEIDLSKEYEMAERLLREEDVV